MRLSDFYNLTNFDIEDPVMATIGGVAFRLFDRLPEPGDHLTHDGYRFVVKQRSGLRISQLQVQKVTSSEQPDDESVEAASTADGDVGEGRGRADEGRHAGEGQARSDTETESRRPGAD
jgi:hypothetical protein